MISVKRQMDRPTITELHAHMFMDGIDYQKSVARFKDRVDTVKELVHIAHEEGFAVMAHASGTQKVRFAAEAGADSICARIRKINMILFPYDILEPSGTFGAAIQK